MVHSSSRLRKEITLYGMTAHCRYTRSGEERRFTASLEIDRGPPRKQTSATSLSTPAFIIPTTSKILHATSFFFSPPTIACLGFFCPSCLRHRLLRLPRDDIASQLPASGHYTPASAEHPSSVYAPLHGHGLPTACLTQYWCFTCISPPNL